MEVPLSSQPSGPSPEGAPARPGAAEVPRWERVGAGLLLAVYAGIWAVTVKEGASPWVVCQALFRIVSGVLTQVRTGASSFDESLVLAGLLGLLNGLFLVILVLAGQALLRACGRDGFLGGRKFWMWSAAHATALLGGYLWFLRLTNTEAHCVPRMTVEWFYVGIHSAAFFISVTMLWASRRRVEGSMAAAASSFSSPGGPAGG